MIFIDSTGQKETVYGSKPYAFYEVAILKLNSTATKRDYSKNLESIFSKYNTLTAKEFSELSGTPRAECEKLLNDHITLGYLEKLTTKNGSIWIKKNTSR